MNRIVRLNRRNINDRGTSNSYKYSQILNLSGTGSNETDYIIPLKLHYGAKKGNDTIDDVFLNSKCQIDFSDIYFTDISGNRLHHYIHSYGNYEIIPDNTHLGTTNIITAGGKIVASFVPGYNGICESDDNGETWTVLNNTAGGQIIWVDPITDLYFANFGNLLKRSDAAHTTWTTVIDMSAVSGYILPYGFCEDAAGTLYAGCYQDAGTAMIWRSLDAGATWEIIYDATGDATKVHVHGVGVDPYTGYVYAGIDGTRKLICSTNASNVAVAPGDVTWTEIFDSAPPQFLFGNGWRMFSTESTLGEVIGAVMKTTDDLSFTADLPGGQSGRIIRQVNGAIYAAVGAQDKERYPQFLRRDALGNWKTIWAAKFDSGAGNDGPRWADKEGIPTGETDTQLLIGPQGAYDRFRLYDGGTHYQALVYVKIPSLPASGGSIIMRYGGHSIVWTIADVYPANLVQSNLLAHYKLDEGSGTAIVDSSGNGKSAVLIPGTGSWNATGGRRIGSNYPHNLLTGTSFHFNGNGYINITGSDTDADFQFTNNFTIVLWAYSANQGGTRWLISKGSAASNHWGLLFNSIGYPVFTYNNPSIWHASQFCCWDGWHCIGFTISADSKLTIYVDGNADSTVINHVLDPVIVVNNTVVRIGATSLGGNAFIGDIDDVQFYNIALTAIQMRQIYENRFVADTEPGLI